MAFFKSLQLHLHLLFPIEKVFIRFASDVFQSLLQFCEIKFCPDLLLFHRFCQNSFGSHKSFDSQQRRQSHKEISSQGKWVLLNNANSGWLKPVYPDLAIYWTFGNFLKHLATINLPRSPTFLGIFVKFSCEIIFRQLLWRFVDFFWSHWLKLIT